MEIKKAGLRKAMWIWASLLVFAFVCSFHAGAAVTVTPAGAGSLTNPSYTGLGNIVITEGANGDFSASAGATLILTAPPGFSFQAGVGSVSFTASQNITSATVAVTAADITVTMSVGATNKPDALTISGINVTASAICPVATTGNIMRTAGNPGTQGVTGITNGATNFGTLSQLAAGVTTGTITGSPFCPVTASINVPFTVCGSFVAGNVFTAQLSNSAGSFAAPTSIGTLSGTASGTVPACVIPLATAPGTQYRIRVISSNPVTTGSDNGVDLTLTQCISTGAVPVSLNTGSSVSVPWTASGSYTFISNSFSAFLSDATGSFATETNIGTCSMCNSNTGNVSATIPCAAAGGTLYRIRIKSTSPAVVATDNGSAITITALPAVTTGSVATPFCQGSTVSIPYTVTCGPMTGGNIFSAELSDNTGAFPGTVIGTLSSTTSGTITGSIPAGASTGVSYRIRVTSSSPSVTGTLNSNGSLTLNAVSITTGAVTTPFCQGAAVSVPYTICGGYTAGNVFTAQLSDNTGSFAVPVNIGTLTSTGAGTVSTVIPVGTSPTGAGYRVRVISSTPSVTGSSNSNGSLTLNPISITTGAVTASFCQGVSISVPYTICGGWTAGNVFTAQLSDNTGSFASPVNIGTLTSTGAGTITAAIPVGTSPTGAGYRVRVVSSTPSVTGAANSNGSLTLNPLSITTGIATAPFCQGASTVSVPFTVCGNFTAGNVFTAELSDAGGNFTGGQVSIGTLTATASGTITATIPVSAATGASYRIRVTGSTPSVTGSLNSNGALTCNALSLTTGTIFGSPFQQGSTVNVPFTVCGGFSAGNVFTAELSTVTGTFPGTNIGTLSGTTSGTVGAAIPGGTTAGTLYRVRVKGSNPAVIAADNGVNLEVIATTATMNAYIWAKSMGGEAASGADAGYRILLDGSGNIFNVGYFSNTADFDPGAGSATLTGGSWWGYLSKYDPSGSFLWAGTLGGAYITDAAIDNSGNLYVTGNFSGTKDFDPGAGTVNITAAAQSPFFAKYDNNGNYLWADAIQITGSGSYCYGNSITVDASNNVYVTGSFSGTGDFDPGSGVANLTTAGTDIFFARYDANGNYAWANKMGGTFYNTGRAISVGASSGNVYLMGIFYGTVDFDPSVGGVASMTSTSSYDIFLAKYTGAGIYMWAKQITISGACTNYSYGTDLITDASENIFVTGNFCGNADFDPSAGGTVTLSSANGVIFFARYDNNGNYGWVQQVGAQATYGVSNAIGLGPTGDVYITGWFGNYANLCLPTCHFTGDFDPGPGTVLLNSSGLGDIFIAEYDASGNYLCAESFGSADAGGAGSIVNEMGSGLTVDALGNVYVTGGFQKTVDFDPGAGYANLVESGPAGDAVDQDIFIAKYGPCSPVILPVTVLQFTGHNRGEKNVIEWSTASESNNEYFAVEKSLSSDDFEEMGRVKGSGNSAFRKNYTITDEHPYHGTTYYRLKQVDFNGSITYSQSISVTGGSLNGVTNIYPNPANTILNCELSAAEAEIFNIEVMDVLGNVIMKEETKAAKGVNTRKLNINSLSQGIYFLKIGNEKKQKLMKFIKQ